jgi:molybdopterin synthase sulfur carrier subunit
LIRNLGDRFPGIADQLLENGDIRPSVAVSIDGEMATGGVLDSVSTDSEVHFIPALGGG